MTTLLVNVTGVLLMLATVWWFWLWKPGQGARADAGKLNIRVADGTYSPDTLDLNAGETVTLEVFRDDASPCSEYFIVDGLGINERLPARKPHRIVLEAPQAGEYPMHCQMNMYQGTIRVS